MNLERITIDEARIFGFEAMMRAHWREVGVDQEEIKLNPHWDRYRELERIEAFVAFALRDGSAIAGYNAFFVMPHLHYQDDIFAVNDVIYLRPEHRGLEGARMILQTERLLVEQFGVRKIHYHSKEDVRFAAEDRRSHDDSLDRIDDIMQLEEEFQIELPDDIGAGDHTFGELLARLGYRKEESTYGKLMVRGE